MKKDYNTIFSARTCPVGLPLFRVKTTRQRIAGLDFLRGVCVLLMMLDHFSFDFMYLPDLSVNFYKVNNAFLVRLSDWLSFTWWESDTRMVLRLIVICIFFSLSGICTSFSQNNLLRGVRLALASVTLSLFTLVADALFDLEISILFGVLHCFTASVFLYVLFSFLCKNYAKYACLMFGFLFVIWGLTLDFYNLQLLPGMDLTGQNIDFIEYLQIALGTRYYGADCFGILPYTGLFLIGAYGGKQLYAVRRPYCPFFQKAPFKPICFIGKNAIWFYLLHQPVIMVFVVIVGSLLGLRFT